MRIAFFGTPVEATRSLHALHEARHDIVVVVTQPDRRRGREQPATASPVRSAGYDLGLPVLTPERAKEVVDDLRDCDAELGVVVAFGQLLPVPVLEALPLGFVNVHFSLLPRWRGAAPVERAILAGDEETGVCLMRLDEGLDTGPVYVSERVVIGAEETAGELRDRLAHVGARLLVEHLDAVPSMEPHPQQGESTMAEKLTPEEFRLDWTRPAAELARVVRAGNPKPGAWAEAGGRRLKVLRARPSQEAPPERGPGELVAGANVVTGAGALVLHEVQVEGRRPVSGEEWARGYRGDRLD